MDKVKQYWDEKILPWEHARYSRAVALYPVAWPLRMRFQTAARVIEDRCPRGVRLFELACGSGLLAERLRDHYSAYSGIDISERAIAAARARVVDPRARFTAGDALASDIPACDLTVFLGFTDWLTWEQLRTLFGRLTSRRLLFSYTHAPLWNPYHLYRAAVDRPLSSEAYRARTYSAERLMNLLAEFGYRGEIIMPPRLFNPGALMWAEAITHD